MNSNNKEKKPKTFWDKLHILAVVSLVIAGIVIMFVSAVNDDTKMVFIGVAMLPGAGILITPKVIRSAIREGRGWKENMFDNKLMHEDFFREVADHSPYDKKIRRAVIREALLNFFALLGIFAFFIAAAVFSINDGIDDGSFVLFLILLGIIIFIVPITAYNITCAAYRIRIALRGEYCVYRSKVKTVDGYDMKIVGKLGVYKFKYCKCLGIHADNVYDIDAILIFVPNEVYLIPDDER